MKTLQLITYFTIGLLLNACTPETDSEQEVDPLATHEVPEFSISFPKTNYSVRTKNFVDEKRNNIVVSSWTLAGTTDDAPFNYSLEFNELPEELHASVYRDSSSLNSTMRRLIMKTAKEMRGKDFEFRTFKSQGYLGIEGVCSVHNGTGRVKSRVYNVDKNFFILSGGGVDVDSNTVDRFLNSFEIVK